MKQALHRGKKIVLRLSIYTLLLACSQPMVESYGCSCANRTYTLSEIKAYRTGAARNEPKALAEMQQYYEWRSWAYKDGSPEHLHEAKIARSFFERRLAINDQEALSQEVGGLLYDTAFEDMSHTLREQKLRRARLYASKQRGDVTTIDLWDDERNMIDTLTYIDRELRYMRDYGAAYYETRNRSRI